MGSSVITVGGLGAIAKYQGAIKNINYFSILDKESGEESLLRSLTDS